MKYDGNDIGVMKGAEYTTSDDDFTSFCETVRAAVRAYSIFQRFVNFVDYFTHYS